jgi:lipopolysaccharide export system permease protein
MLKNKIYNYLAGEIFKNFITILLTFTAIAWTVRAVNFLDLMIEDGFSVYIYFKYSLLNISTIVTRFVPLSFLLSMIISIAKFERQQELLILWTTGTNKIKIANIFFLIGFSIALLQIILGVIVNPLTLNKSRALLREADNIKINSVLKSGDFSDIFKGITFYIDKKSSSNELIDIFIRDSNGSLSTAVGKINNSVNTTILAKKGTVVGDKLVLYNGKIQTIDEKKTIKNINFEKTELSIKNFSTRTITQPKIQETSSIELFNCLIGKFLQNCAFKKNKKIVIENLSRRVGMPLYIPLISVISSYLLIYKKNIRYNFIRKYIVFIFAFIVLIAGEVLLRFSGFSITNFVLYFFSPLILLIILYTILLKKTMSERV